jgi:hypothetical protein
MDKKKFGQSLEVSILSRSFCPYPYSKCLHRIAVNVSKNEKFMVLVA